MFKTQQIKLTGNISDELHDYLVYLCENASSLVNCVIYQIKQKHFEVCERVEFFDKKYRERIPKRDSIRVQTSV